MTVKQLTNLNSWTQPFRHLWFLFKTFKIFSLTVTYLFRDNTSLCSSGCSGIVCINQTGLKQRPACFCFWVLRLKMWVTMPISLNILNTYTYMFIKHIHTHIYVYMYIKHVYMFYTCLIHNALCICIYMCIYIYMNIYLIKFPRAIS